MLQVLFLLCGGIVTSPIDFDDELAVKEHEIRNVLKACEEVLCAIAFPEGRNGWLQGFLGLRHVDEQEVGVPEEVIAHGPTPASEGSSSYEPVDATSPRTHCPRQ